MTRTALISSKIYGVKNRFAPCRAVQYVLVPCNIRHVQIFTKNYIRELSYKNPMPSWFLLRHYYR